MTIPNSMQTRVWMIKYKGDPYFVFPNAPEIPVKQKKLGTPLYLNHPYPCLHAFWYCNPYFLEQFLMFIYLPP